MIDKVSTPSREAPAVPPPFVLPAPPSAGRKGPRKNDIVSKLGVHYGDIARIPGTSANPLTEHRMTTMNAVLALNAISALDIAAF